MRKLITIAWVLAMMVVMTPNGVLAQGIDGTLRGEVKDPSGAVVPAAKVTIKEQSTGSVRSIDTSSTGIFAFPNLLVGVYTLDVEAKGFKKYVRTDVSVQTNQVTDVTVLLEVGAATTTIEVSAGGELLQTSTAQLSTSWSSKQVTDLPLPVLSGDPQNLAILQVGTTTQSGGVVGVGGSIGGNRPRNNSFVVDGVDNNDVSVTGPSQPYIPDSIAEFTLLTNQFSAEYGHSTAGQFIQVTKAGTNNWHGDGFEFMNNRKLNSADNLTNAGIARGDLPAKPRFDRNRLGGTVGGPIMKDKLFVFGAYQYTLENQASTPGSATLVPTASGFSALSSLAANPASGVSSVAVGVLTDNLPPAASASGTVDVVNDGTGAVVPIDVGVETPAAPDFLHQHQFQINMDYVTGRHRISGRYADDRERLPNVAVFPLPSFTGSQAFDARSLTVSEVFLISPQVVNELRAGYRRSILALTVPSLKLPGGLDVFPNFIIEELNGLEIGPDGNAPQSSFTNAYQITDTLTYSRGRHSIKVGADYRWWIAPTLFLPRERAEYRYSGLDAFVKDLEPDNLALRGVGDGSFAGNQKAIYLFFQDDVKVSPRLTLNLGVRYELSTNPRDDKKQLLNSAADLTSPTNPGLPPLVFGVPKKDTNNFSPRIGFAWDVFGDHKTSIRGGFGIAYDVIFQNLPLLQLPPQLQQELGVDQACAFASPPAWCATRTNFIRDGGLPGTFVPQQLSVDDARAGTQGLIVDTVAPVSYTWSLSLQRQFGNAWAVEGRYVGTRGLRLPVQIRRNIRQVPPDNLFLPTFFSASDVPATVSLAASSAETFSDAAVRPYAADGFLSNVTAFDPIGSSTYHGGSIEVTRRLSGLGRAGNGLFLKSGYTYSKAIDNSTNELFTSQVNPRRPEDPNNLRNERGRSVIDHTHKFSLAVIYELPRYAGTSWFAKGFLNQWQVSATYIAESGQPVTALSFEDANGNRDAAADRAILNPNGVGLTATDVSSVCRDSVTGATSIVFPDNCDAADTVGYVANNPSARYVQALRGARTTVGRNTLTSAGINNTNLGIFKTTSLGESRLIEFRADFLNVFNHPQPILGSGNINLATDNAINGTGLAFVGDNPDFQRPENLFSTGAGNSPFSRLIQFSLKFIF